MRIGHLDYTLHTLAVSHGKRTVNDAVSSGTSTRRDTSLLLHPNVLPGSTMKNQIRVKIPSNQLRILSLMKTAHRFQGAIVTVFCKFPVQDERPIGIYALM